MDLLSGASARHHRFMFRCSSQATRARSCWPPCRKTRVAGTATGAGKGSTFLGGARRCAFAFGPRAALWRTADTADTSLRQHQFNPICSDEIADDRANLGAWVRGVRRHPRRVTPMGISFRSSIKGSSGTKAFRPKVAPEWHQRKSERRQVSVS